MTRALGDPSTRRALAVFGLLILLGWILFGGGGSDIGRSLERVRGMLGGCR